MKQKMKQTWQRLIADRKRFGFFCTLLLVALLLWARVIVITRPPRTAVADQSYEQAVAIAEASDNVFIPVHLDIAPSKNPFVVSNVIFPALGTGTDNSPIQPINSTDETVQSLVQGFELEAVMADMAIIDGSVYQLGDTVVGPGLHGQIRVIEVKRRSVILSHGDRRYELTIASSHQ
jgi:hypothetical protein